MARSKKDGKYGGGHKCWRGSWLKMDGRCGVNGKPTGVREPLGRKAKRSHQTPHKQIATAEKQGNLGYRIVRTSTHATPRRSMERTSENG